MKKLFNRLYKKRSGLLVQFDYYKTRFKVLYVLIVVLLSLALVVTIFPPIWLILSSFKDASEIYRVPFTLWPDTFDFSKIVEVWNILDFSRYYLNSILVTLGAVAASLVFNGLLAYSISVVKPSGYKIVFALVMASLMIPPILNMGPLFNSIVTLGLTNSLVPLALLFGANPFYFILFKTYFDSLPPALFEAARIDGANKFQVFKLIVLPLSKPIVAVVSIFTITAAWSDFLLPFLVLQSDSKQTVMVKIYQLYNDMGTSMGFGPDSLLMVIAFSIVPPVVLFFIFQRHITSTVATTGIRE